MLRLMVTGRGIALTATALAAVIVLLGLGQWQWQRSRPDVLVASLATVDVGEVIPGDGRLLTRDQGRRVSVSGTWRPDRQLLVADRQRPGADEAGRWVVTAVEVEADGGTRLVPVVRGWVAGAAATSGLQPQGGPAGPSDLPAGPAEVEGWIQASEALDVPVDVVQPPGVVSLLAGADLVNRWPETILDGFVIADAAVDPDGAGAGEAMADGVMTGIDAPLPGPVESARAGRDWRNVAYAGQWWVFAAFAAVLWWRALQDGAPRPGSARSGTGDDDDEGGT